MTQRSHLHPARGALGASVALAAAFALAGCGGGGSNSIDTATTTEAVLPPSAGADAPAFTNYTSTLQPNDEGEPVALGDFVPPLDDTAEPTPVGG